MTLAVLTMEVGDRRACWLGEVEGDLRQGGEFRARYFASVWEGTGRVQVCEPPHRLLILTSSTDGPDGVIEATLTADGDQTILVIEVGGKNSIPPTNSSPAISCSTSSGG